MNLEAVEARGHVRDHVVVAVEAVGINELLTDGILPAARERRGLAHQSVRAVGANEFADAAERNRTEGALQVDLRFTTEEAAAVAERARIGIETVFKDEAELEAVAEVFRALQAEARAGVLAGHHLERVVRVDILSVAVNVLIVEAVVDQAVERDISGSSGTGKSAEDSESSKSLFHFECAFDQKSAPLFSEAVQTEKRGEVRRAHTLSSDCPKCQNLSKN